MCVCEREIERGWGWVGGGGGYIYGVIHVKKSNIS